MFCVTQTGVGRSQGHNVHAIPDLMRPQALNRFRFSHAIATTQSCHSVDLRKSARYDQIWMVADQRYHAFIVRAIGVVKISLVHQNHGLPGDFVDELADFILWCDAGRGIVRIADINQSLAGGCRHFREVVTEARRKWNLDDLGGINSGVVKNGFESWIGNNQLSSTWSEHQSSSAGRARQWYRTLGQ